MRRRHAARHHEVAGIIDEAQTEKIDILLDRELNILAVTRCQRSATDERSRQRDALATHEQAAASDLADRLVAIDPVDQQLDQAVGDQQAAARLHHIQQLGIVDADPL